jgi:hypothetical protein
MYAAAWLTLSWGSGSLALLVINRVPRQIMIATGLLLCQTCLSIEAALVANFVGTTNTAALKAAVAMLFIFVFIYQFCMDSTMFVYLGELFPNHIRAKGVSLGVSTLATMNTIWLTAAPTAFEYEHPSLLPLLFSSYPRRLTKTFTYLQKNRMEVLSSSDCSGHRGSYYHPHVLSKYTWNAAGRNCCPLWSKFNDNTSDLPPTIRHPSTCITISREEYSMADLVDRIKSRISLLSRPSIKMQSSLRRVLAPTVNEFPGRWPCLA